MTGPSLAPRFQVGQLVRFTEGKTQQERQGVVRDVFQSVGWPPEYGVRVLKLNGTASARITRKHQSELAVVSR